MYAVYKVHARYTVYEVYTVHGGTWRYMEVVRAMGRAVVRVVAMHSPAKIVRHKYVGPRLLYSKKVPFFALLSRAGG